MDVTVKFRSLAEDLPIPTQWTHGSNGFDLHARISENIIIKPQNKSVIPCGIIVKLPRNFVAEIRGRSGLVLNHSVVAFNGLIDNDYRGEICVVLFNLHPSQNFVVKRGERIAQIVFRFAPTIRLLEVESIDATTRGSSGFGSTGI